MALRPTRRPPQLIIEADRLAVEALQELHDYSPLNGSYTAAALQNLATALAQAEQNEGRARRELDAAREATLIAANAFHDAVLGAKAQVIAQYGPDSLAVQAIGLTRRSERRRPARRTATQ